MTPENMPVSRTEFNELRRTIFGNGAPGLSGDMRDMKRIIEEMQGTQEEEAQANKTLRDEWAAIKNQLKGAKLVLWIIAILLGFVGTVGGAKLSQFMSEVLARLP